MTAIIDDQQIVGAQLLQLGCEHAVDPLLRGLFVLEIDDLRFRNSALLEEVDECGVPAVLDRKEPNMSRCFQFNAPTTKIQVFSGCHPSSLADAELGVKTAARGE